MLGSIPIVYTFYLFFTFYLFLLLFILLFLFFIIFLGTQNDWAVEQFVIDSWFSFSSSSANRDAPQPAQLQVVGRLDLFDFLLETVDGSDERRAVLAGAGAQVLHLAHDVAESVVETDHVLPLGRRRHEQAPERIRVADVVARRAFASYVNIHTHIPFFILRFCPYVLIACSYILVSAVSVG